MKTAISVPDELFASVAKWTSALGINRSAFFARAVARYVAELEAASLTEQVDAALELAGDETWRDVAGHARTVLAGDDAW